MLCIWPHIAFHGDNNVGDIVMLVTWSWWQEVEWWCPKPMKKIGCRCPKWSKKSPISYKCHQHLLLPTFVTNIDVTLFITYSLDLSETPRNQFLRVWLNDQLRKTAMEDKLDNGFIKNHFESPQYGESTFSDSGHVIFQKFIFAIVCSNRTIPDWSNVILTPINSIIRYLNAKGMVNRN